MAASTFRDLLRHGESVLVAGGISSPRLDAEVLLSAAAGSDRSQLYARLMDPVDAEVEARFRAALERRRGAEPIAYITGEREFWSLCFAVDERVLIPRPESELLVQTTLELLERGRESRVLDLGTGSGCLAVALAKSALVGHVLAVDVSPLALDVARENAKRHGVAERIDFVALDLFGGLAAGARFDVIVSNPPYVRNDEALAADVAVEPTTALRAGAEGLDTIRRLVAEAPPRLVPGGWLVMEFGCGQERAVRELARAAGFTEVSVRHDLAGIPRALVASRGGAGDLPGAVS